MNKLTFFSLFAILSFYACEKESVLTSSEFYESYVAESVTFTVDRTLFLEGGQPINMEAYVFSDIGEQLPNVPLRYVVNVKDTLEGNTFTPKVTGTYKIFAITADGVRSKLIDISAVMAADFDNTFGFSFDFLQLKTDRSLQYVEGEPPINFQINFREQFLSQRFQNTNVKYIINGDTTENTSFIPNSTGTQEVYAITAQGLKSNKMLIKSVVSTDLESFDLQYNGIDYLTTNPWSFSGQFSPLVVANGVTNSFSFNEQMSLFVDGQKQDTWSTLNFVDAGVKRVHFEFKNLRSQEQLITVRAKKDYESVELPIIFHFYKQDDLVNEQLIQFELNRANRLFNAETISATDITVKSDNPNKVNTNIKFYLADRAPSGDLLEKKGIHIIESGNSETTTFSDIVEIGRQNYWDPNHYLNIYVGEGDWSGNGSFNPAGLGGFARLLIKEQAGSSTVNSEPLEPYFNSIFLNGNLSGNVLAHEIGHVLNLHHNFSRGCTNEGDYVKDTYAYTWDSNGPITPKFEESCEEKKFTKSNVMDYGGTGTTFTYGQRERLHTLIEHGLFIPSPKNRMKPIRQHISEVLETTHQF